MHYLSLERRNAEQVTHAVEFAWLYRDWNEEIDAPQGRVNVWAGIVFEALEAKITDILRAARLPDDLTAHRSATVFIQSLKRTGDPSLSSGIPLNPALEAGQQADALWDFCTSRFKPLLTRLQSPTVLADLTAPAPVDDFSWSTRRMLWHALQGNHSTATRIAMEMQASAPEVLTAGVRGLQAHAAANGHTFWLSPGALDYTTASVWQEFVAVRDAVTRMDLSLGA
jgi:hypothetical protein